MALPRKELDRCSSDSLSCTPSPSANPREKVTFCDMSGLSQNCPSPCLVFNGKWHCFFVCPVGKDVPLPEQPVLGSERSLLCTARGQAGLATHSSSSCSLGQAPRAAPMAVSGHNLLRDEFISCFLLVVKQALLTGWHAPLCYQL